MQIDFTQLKKCKSSFWLDKFKCAFLIDGLNFFTYSNVQTVASVHVVLTHFVLIIHSLVFYARLFQFRVLKGGWSLSQGHWVRGRLHPGQVAIPSQGHTETNNHARHACPSNNLESPINLSQRTWREPMHTRGEHANSTQLSRSQESNLEPSRCEATVLTTTPPFN